MAPGVLAGIRAALRDIPLSGGRPFIRAILKDRRMADVWQYKGGIRVEKRTTIYDLAAKLGVSVATVNRALTDKPRVSDETRKKVREAAQEMGFKPNALARSLSRRVLRLGVLAFTSFPEFHSQFIEGAKSASSELVDFNVSTDFFSYDEGMSDTPQAEKYLHDRLQYFLDEKYDGVLVLARQTEDFAGFAQRGVFLATAVNDIDPKMRRFHVCYNGFVAGKIAAELIYRFMPDRSRPVAIASAWKGLGIHSTIDSGFCNQLQSTPMKLFRICYNKDNENTAYESTIQLMKDCPDLGAIYVDSFNSRGVIRAIEHAGKLGEILLVTSDIYDDLRKWIADGVVMASIFQNQFEQGRQGIHMLYHSIADNESYNDVVMIDPQIILASNADCFTKR